MKILMVSGDPSILVSGSAAERRMRFYGRAAAELHILAPSEKKAEPRTIGNLFFYPASRPLGMYRRGKRLCAERTFDVITAQGADETGVIGYMLARTFHIPFQLQIHTDIASPWYRRASWKEEARFWLARFLIPRAECIRVVSRRVRDSLSAKFRVPSSTFSLLPIFTDVSLFAHAQADPACADRFRAYEFKIVSFGRFVDREKNFCMLIDAMRDFARVCPEALLVLAGDGPDKKKYESRIAACGLAHHVILEPYRENLASFLKAFDLFVLPSRYEGWGAAVVEAASAGLPIVMTDVGLAGEVIINRESGLVVPVGDQAALTHALIEMRRNPDKRKEYAKKGQERVLALDVFQGDAYAKAWARSFGACLEKSLSSSFS